MLPLSPLLLPLHSSRENDPASTTGISAPKVQVQEGEAEREGECDEGELQQLLDELMQPAADALCHVFYTSGSTGVPKGCRVTHGSVDAYAAAKNGAHGVDVTARVFVASSVSFDPQVSFTSYLPLAAFLSSAPNPLRCRDAQLKVFSRAQLARRFCRLQVGDIVATLAAGAVVCTAPRDATRSRLDWCLQQYAVSLSPRALPVSVVRESARR